MLLVIDQFRADYIDMYSSQWTRGLRRLVDKGAVFTNARYPYGNTVTCAGHATIGTGAFPARHGMVGNTWYDRTLRKTVACAEDASVTSVPFGGAKGTEHHSPHNLLIPNFADELRRQTPSRPAQIVSVALKPRSAISMGGHASPTTTVIWEEDDGTWATSTAYASTPWPDADAYVKAHPLAAANGEVWAMFMPPTAYKYVDDGLAEAKPVPWTRNFPHTLHNPLTWQPDRVFVTAWERSPKSDEFVTGLAIELLRTRKLGQQPGTDMLAVSLPALDLVAHEYGPRSWEAQDVLARADVQVGLLLDALDKAVGPDNYLLAFSADHGVATMPDQLVAEGQDAGRIPTTMAATTLRPVLEKLLGPAPQPPPVTVTNPTTGVTTQTTPMPTWIGAVDGAQVSLLPGVVDKLRGSPGGLQHSEDDAGRDQGHCACLRSGRDGGLRRDRRSVSCRVAFELRARTDRRLRDGGQAELDHPRRHGDDARLVLRLRPARAGDLLRQGRQERPQPRTGDARGHRADIRRVRRDRTAECAGEGVDQEIVTRASHHEGREAHEGSFPGGPPHRENPSWPSCPSW